MQFESLRVAKTEEFMKDVFTPFAEDWAETSVEPLSREHVKAWFSSELTTRLNQAFNEHRDRRLREAQAAHEKQEADRMAEEQVRKGAQTGETFELLAERTARRVQAEANKERQQPQGKANNTGMVQGRSGPVPIPKAPAAKPQSNRAQDTSSKDKPAGQKPAASGQKPAGQKPAGQKPVTGNGGQQKESNTSLTPAQSGCDQGNKKDTPPAPAKSARRKRQLDAAGQDGQQPPRSDMSSPAYAGHKANGKRGRRARKSSPPAGQQPPAATEPSEEDDAAQGSDHTESDGEQAVSMDESEQDVSDDEHDCTDDSPSDSSPDQHRPPADTLHDSPPNNGVGGDRLSEAPEQQQCAQPSDSHQQQVGHGNGEDSSVPPAHAE
jgi:hypothetical protein